MGQLTTLPRIGAGKAWLLNFMLLSMFFNFYCIIEYIIVNYLTRIENRVAEARKLAKEARIKNFAENVETIFNSSKVKIDIDASQPHETELSLGILEEYGTICKIDRLVMRENGTMIVKDQDLDIFSRYAYPICYTVLCFYFRYKLQQLK